MLWLSRFREPTGILARWLSILGAYDYDIIFRQGYLHTNADSLSRKRNCPFPECLDCSQGNQSTQNDGLQQSAQGYSTQKYWGNTKSVDAESGAPFSLILNGRGSAKSENRGMSH